MLHIIIALALAALDSTQSLHIQQLDTRENSV